MSRKQNDGYYEVLWPRAERQVKRKTLATRLDSLEGKTVAQLWDFIFRGDAVFDALEGGLKARYAGINFISWRDFGNTHGRPPPVRWRDEWTARADRYAQDFAVGAGQAV